MYIYAYIRANPRVGLYTILPLPTVYSVYGNKRRSGGTNILRNRVGDTGGVGVPKRRGYSPFVLG